MPNPLHLQWSIQFTDHIGFQAHTRQTKMERSSVIFIYSYDHQDSMHEIRIKGSYNLKNVAF